MHLRSFTRCRYRHLFSIVEIADQRLDEALNQVRYSHSLEYGYESHERAPGYNEKGQPGCQTATGLIQRSFTRLFPRLQLASFAPAPLVEYRLEAWVVCCSLRPRLYLL
jgi:hypothetical protein